MSDQPQAPPTEPLSADEISLIEEIQQRATDQIQGILMLAARTRKLEGRWHVTDDKRALVKVG